MGDHDCRRYRLLVMPAVLGVTPGLGVLAVAGGAGIWDTLQLVAIGIVAVIGGGVVHEYGHAWAATRLGDDLPLRQGRLTLNPIPHLHPMLSVVLPILTGLFMGMPIGGMNPVRFNPTRFRHPARGAAITGLAGPAFELVFALGVLIVALLVSPLVHPNSWAAVLLYIAFVANVLIAAFNLIPFPPLDGSHVLRYLLPPRARVAFDRIPFGFALMAVFLLIMLAAANDVPIMGWLVGPIQDVYFAAHRHFALSVLLGG